MRTSHFSLATALIACCAASHAPAAAQFQSAAEQRVELASFDFSPREIHLRAGQPYKLVLTNLSSGGHDFSAPEFFSAARIAPDDAALVDDGEVEVPARATRRVTLVPAAGTYKLTCTHFGHALLGMKGKIVVE